MPLDKLIEGLQIAQKYYDAPDGYKTCAEHDVLYLYETDKQMSEADEARMKELGWAKNTEGWRAFT